MVADHATLVITPSRAQLSLASRPLRVICVKPGERRVFVRFPHQQTFAGPADVSHLAHQPASSIGAQIPR
jgi:hypothetical protein